MKTRDVIAATRVPLDVAELLREQAARFDHSYAAQIRLVLVDWAAKQGGRK